MKIQYTMIDENNTNFTDEIPLFISVFPNPVSDFLHVNIPHFTNWTIKLYTIHGKNIVASNTRNPIDVSGLQKRSLGIENHKYTKRNIRN